MALKFMGRKRGMTQLFDENGHVIPCTVIETELMVVTQIKRKETDGYNAIQVGFGKITTKDPRTAERRMKKPQRKAFEKNSIENRKHLMEIRVDNVDEYTVGQEISVQLLSDMTHVDITGTSKGKGFQGLMKKHGFSGGPAAHGSGFHRHAGSTGMRSTPGICFKNGPRPSRMGGQQVTTQNLEVVSVDPDQQVVIVKGAVPGAVGGLVIFGPAIKLAAK